MRPEAGPSNWRSLGSDQCFSGRFPKVSIGITVEKCPKMGPLTKKENGIALPTGERVPSSQEKVLDVNRGSMIVEASGRNQPTKDQNAAEWLSTRSVHHETTLAETVKVYANRASALQSEDGVHKTSDTFAFGKRREKVGNVERVEEVTFSVMQDMHVQDKGRREDQTEGMLKHNNEALRMKLWEILATSSENKHILNPPDLENSQRSNIRESASQHKQNVNSPDLDNTKTFDMKQKRKYQSEKVGKVAKRKQNSDTIETDSESPNQTVRRPITRSLTRKRAPAKHGKMPLSSSSSGSKLKLEEKSIFAFEEEERKAGRLDETINGLSSRSRGKRSEHKKGKIEPRRICFPQFASDKCLQTNDREQTLPSPNKASQESKKTGNALFLPYLGVKDISRPSVEVPNPTCHSEMEAQKRAGCQTACSAGAHECFGSPLLKKKTNSCQHTKSPPEPKNAYHDSRTSPLRESEKYPSDNFQSPTLAISRSSLRSKVPDEALCSHALEKSRPGSYGSEFSDADTESSDDTREILESQDMGSPLVEEVTGTEKQPFSPIEDQTQIFQANDYIVKGYSRRDKWFSDASSPEKSPVAFHHKKGIYSFEDERTSNKTLSPPSTIGNSRTEEAIGLHETSEKHPEDTLARAICQLALVLRKFKAKIKLQRSKKSSEILSTAAENIHLLLQDAESRMAADVGKFISTGKTKRKHLESRFQEQQGTLKFIHDKFKEEINQHVLDCKSTLEELEAHQIELKGSVDRQKASHRKLLQEVQEAMNAQLNDAEARIAAIHRETQKKTTGLKLLLKEWLKECATT